MYRWLTNDNESFRNFHANHHEPLRTIMRITVLIIAAIMLLVIFSVLFSCGFVDLRPIGFSIEPDHTDTVLPSEYSRVSISFDTAMDTQTVDGIITISSDTGIVDGDVSWTGNTMYFSPVPPWTAGIRYVLKISGLVRSVNGRELRIEKYLCFYAIHNAPAPLLE